MEPISTRVHRWLKNEIVRFGRTHNQGPAEALRRVAEEWWTMQEFPAITFRESTTGRRAALRSGPDVWEVIMVWRDYGPQEREAFHRHWGGRIPEEHLAQALRYYERFPEEIDERLAWNERVAAQLASQEQ